MTVFKTIRRGALFSRRGPYLPGHLTGRMGPGGPSSRENGAGGPHLPGKMGRGGPIEGGPQNFMTPAMPDYNETLRLCACARGKDVPEIIHIIIV